MCWFGERFYLYAVKPFGFINYSLSTNDNKTIKLVLLESKVHKKKFHLYVNTEYFVKKNSVFLL